MNIAAIVASILATLLKTIFGTDKPQETVIINEIPEIPIGNPADSDLLSELGL